MILTNWDKTVRQNEVEEEKDGKEKKTGKEEIKRKQST